MIHLPFGKHGHISICLESTISGIRAQNKNLEDAISRIYSDIQGLHTEEIFSLDELAKVTSEFEKMQISVRDFSLAYANYASLLETRWNEFKEWDVAVSKENKMHF